MNFKEYDFPGIINGERVDSVAKWFEDNPNFCGLIEIEIPAKNEEIFRICVKKQLVIPTPLNLNPIPRTQMLGKKIGNFAGFYIMELWCEDNPEIRWRGKVPKHMILDMEPL